MPRSLPPGSGHSKCSASERHILLYAVLNTMPLAQPASSPWDTRQGVPGSHSLASLLRGGGRFLLSGLFTEFLLVGWPVRPCTTSLRPFPALTPPLSLLFPLLQRHLPPHCSHKTPGTVLPPGLCMCRCRSLHLESCSDCHLSGLRSSVLSCERPPCRPPAQKESPRDSLAPSNSF